MFFFSSDSGAVVVSNSSTFMTLRFDELEAKLTAIITAVIIEPKPIIQNHGTVGGENYLNILGEDATLVRISGYVVGSGCGAAKATSTAINNAVDFFQDYGVIGRAEPVSYAIGSSSRRYKAYLVAATIAAQGDVRDVVKFDYVLLSEPFSAINAIGGVPQLPATPGNSSVAAAEPTLKRTPTQPAAGSAIESNGEVLAPQTVSVSS